MTLANRRNLMTSESGIAMPAVILVVAILAILAVGSVRTVGDEVKASTQMSESAKAFYAAEAGVDLIMATWDSLKYDTLMPNPGDTAVLDWRDLPENGAGFRAMLQRVDDGGQPGFSVRVQGRGGISGGSTRNIGVIVQPGGGGGGFHPFQWALFGDQALEFENTPDVVGNVASNGDIIMVNNPTITGDAQAGGTVQDHSAVSGTVTESSPPTAPFDEIPCPSLPYGPLPSEYKSWNASLGNIVIHNASTSVFSGGVYYFNSFSKRGDNDIVVPPGDTAIIFVEGGFTYQGMSDANPAPSPAASLQIYGCGPGQNAWQLGGGGSVLNMVIYAPKRFLILQNEAVANGSFVGRRVEKVNEGTVTYDPTVASLELPFGLGGGGGGGVATMMKRTWTEF